MNTTEKMGALAAQGKRIKKPRILRTATIDLQLKMMPFPHGVPSHDTNARVLAKLNPMVLESCFAQWMSDVAQLSEYEVVAIDGKTLGRAWDNRQGGEFVHMVSAWANSNGFLLAKWAAEPRTARRQGDPTHKRLLAFVADEATKGEGQRRGRAFVEVDANVGVGDSGDDRSQGQRLLAVG